MFDLEITKKLTSDQGAHESFNEEVHLAMQQALNSHSFLWIMTIS